MEILFYFLLRRFFVRLEFNDNSIRISKGLFLRRETVVPFNIITIVEIERTVPLRILKAKKITVKTLAGKVFFFLKKEEALPFSFGKGITMRPKTSASILGAFIDTKALSGVLVFSLTLNRIGNVFGKRYYDKIISVISDTAESLADTLSVFNVAIPKLTALITVFVCAAWLFALLKNFMKYARFRLISGKESVTVKRGLITLYECTVVLNNLNAAVISVTPATMIFRKSPIYVYNQMIFPAADDKTAKKIIYGALGIKIAGGRIYKPPKKAFFGHIAIPFWWAAGLAFVLILAYAAENLIKGFSVPLLKSFLWIGTALSLWYCLLFGIYMKFSGISFGKRSLFIYSRHGASLKRVYIPYGADISYTIGVNIFQKRNGLCDLRVNCVGHRHFTIKNIDGIELKHP